DFRPGMPWERLREICADFRSQWADGAVITGGEPTLHEGLPRLVARLKAGGFAVKLDTNGSRPDALECVIDDVDYVAMDIKCAPGAYAEMTGFGDVEALGRSIRLIRDRARDSEFRTTVIESLHDDVQMAAIGDWLRGARRYVLQPFVPRETLPDEKLQTLPRTRPQRLAEWRERMKDCADEVIVRGE
ncbi:MAG: radical SAM protein, partial [Kiritimatiellia bacterium]|nr:radical SAM protein [Kiritimatiellia bacterium]